VERALVLVLFVFVCVLRYTHSVVTRHKLAARARVNTLIIHARIVEAPATPREPMANVAMDARARGLARAFRDEVSTMRACVTRREVWDEYDNKIFTITHLSR
jgi:hypothetical protein